VRVILSSKVPHYYHAALALQKAGCLAQYICAVGVHQRSWWSYKVLPERWEKKLRGRDISGVDPERVMSLWLPEVLQKGLPRTGLISKERGDWLADHLFDRMAARHLAQCDFFHFSNGAGLYSARRARQNGATVLCDQRTPYPDFERQIIREEYEKLGLKFNPPGVLADRRVKAEYALADYFVIGSSFAKQSFVDVGYNPDRIFVVPYGTVIHCGDQTLPGDDGCFRIIYVGQIVPRKGVHYLVQAFEELSLPASELALIGPAGEDMRPLVEEWVRRNPGITAPGSVPHVELIKHYRRGSVFVLPSVSEGLALVIGEAMAAGLPVIVTENTGSSEMVRRGINGFVVPIRDVEALKESILRLYENPGLRRQMGKAARNRARSFSWQQYGQRLISVYEEIARRDEIAP